MKILAFLQNMWVRDPHKVQCLLTRDTTGRLREKLIARALFAGCLTGRRLIQAFGQDLCSEIIWEEASPVISNNPRDYFPPDPPHIRAVLEKHQPGIVLCFTKAGEDVIRGLLPASTVFIPAVHPASRSRSTVSYLRSTAATLNGLLKKEAA